MKQVIFTLASARSGTLYLRNLFRNNIRHCRCRHEPFFDRGNPTLFGPAIYDAYAGRVDRIRALLARKREYINRLPGKIYLESSHAFLKSAFVAALEVFPQMQLVHLVRNPLKVAKSEAYREFWRKRVHAPFHYYKGDDGRLHFYWSLTTNEEIFQSLDLASLTLFQRYFVQWIEIENRAQSFLDNNHLRERCFTLNVPDDLNDRARVQEMFDFFGLELARPAIILRGRKNRGFGTRTLVTRQNENEASQVLQRLPARYLRIFQREPYASRPWRRLLLGNISADLQAPQTPTPAEVVVSPI